MKMDLRDDEEEQVRGGVSEWLNITKKRIRNKERSNDAYSSPISLLFFLFRQPSVSDSRMMIHHLSTTPSYSSLPSLP
jgi:hypothetical protein